MAERERHPATWPSQRPTECRYRILENHSRSHSKGTCSLSSSPDSINDLQCKQGAGVTIHTLSLANNDLDHLKQLERLPMNLPDIRALDLSGNPIKAFGELDNLAIRISASTLPFRASNIGVGRPHSPGLQEGGCRPERLLYTMRARKFS